MIIFLVWLWISNVVILLGAEFNAELERGRQIEAGQRPNRNRVSSRGTRRRPPDIVDEACDDAWIKFSYAGMVVGRRAPP